MHEEVPQPTITPTATWTHPAAELNAPRDLDVGQCFVGDATNAAQGWTSAAPLLGLKGHQFSNLTVPCIPDPTKLWSLRHQFFTTNDRIRLLEAQQQLWADDELRFHMHDIVTSYAQEQHRAGNQPQDVVVLDPLVSAAWIEGYAFPCEQWAQNHLDIRTQQKVVIGVFRLDHHWIPVYMAPAGSTVHVHTWDCPSNDHAALNDVLHRLCSALGFTHVSINRQQRMFFLTNLCGALAIAFLHHALHRSQLPTSHDESQYVHDKLRAKFKDAMVSAQIAMRPWVWGSGDSLPHTPAAPVPNDPDTDIWSPRRTEFVPSASHICIPLKDRLNMIADHGTAMGDDELRFHLHVLAIKYRELEERPGWGVLVFDPLNFHNWDDVGHVITERWCHSFAHVRTMGIRVMTAMCLHNHWVPLWLVPDGLTLDVFTFSHDDHADHDIVDGILRWMSFHLGFSEIHVHRAPEALPPHQMCGAHALAYFAHVLLDAPLPTSISELSDMNTEMRSAFVQEIYANRVCRCPTLWGTGGSGNLLRSLADELSKHGVPPDVVDIRSAQAIKAIGSDQLIQALQQKQPWRQLKALANNVNFKFVPPDELAAVVEANKMQSVGKKRKDKPPPGLPGPIALDPSKLQVIDGTFRTGGQVLPQLHPSQIGPLSSGFVLMTAQDADPYLKSGQTVSKEPLALVVFHRSDTQLQSMLPQTKIMVPCRCTVDNEPVLSEASLFQIGTGIVEKHSGTNLVTIDSPDVFTMKLSVYRDEYNDDWNSFSQAPIKNIVGQFPELKRCMATGCQCPAWHNDELLDIKEPIIDLWKRQYLKGDLKPCEAGKATFFAVNIRVPDCLRQKLLSRSGQNGIYVEPRSPDGKSVLPEYMIVWSSKHTLQELLHVKQTNPAVVGLARVGERRGLRVLATQAEEIHNIVKPGTLFLPHGDRLMFTVGPFPFGLDRQAISKIMKNAGWSCKPLQPSMPQPGRGAMWNVVAVEEPPTTIVPTTHGEILITKQRSHETTSSAEDKYVSLWRTIEHSAAQKLPFPPAKNSRGRACTSETKPVVGGKFAPVRIARKGDFQPHFHGASLRHAQWIRQARRIQSYLRAVKDDVPPSSHACQTWGSILRAKGFTPTFVDWWLSSTHKVHGAPAQLSWTPPSRTTASAIFDSFALAVRAFEAELACSSRQYAKCRRANDPHLIFRDIKQPARNGVDFLLKPLVSVIAEVDHEAHALIVSPAQKWHADKPVYCHGFPLQIIHAEADCLWVESVEGIQPGFPVSQVKCTGSKEDLAHAFLSTWAEKWERHRDVPVDRWNVILDFARAHLPRLVVPRVSIDVSALSLCIAQKKQATAGGLDGVTLQDLKCMPSGVLQNFCHLFDGAESTGEWPPQLVSGRVACIAKRDDPVDVLDYRPITILGLLYRIWGTCHARRLIRVLEPIMPDTLFGSRPSRFAGQVWSQTLWAVEFAQANDVHLCGLIAGLQKAFNYLPRLIVFEAAAVLGLPLPCLTAWAGALSTMGRRFQLGDNLTRPVFSCTGFPEGDALSGVGMMIVDLLWHTWHRCYFPLCEPISYVDDWQLLVTDPAAMTGAFACLTGFTDAMDLLLDAHKTFTWSITPEGRQSLLHQGFGVTHSCRSLGAHMQFTRQHTNATQMDRLQCLPQLWSKLRLSASPYLTKVRAIKVAAWPRALHAIAATTLSQQTFQTLRAGAVKGLNMDGAGCNAHSHMLCEGCTLDPQCWSILQTLRFARDCGHEEAVLTHLCALVGGESSIALNGITGTLLSRLQTLGWHVSPQGYLYDTFGPFSLFDISVEELQWRVAWAWNSIVAAEVQHRPGLVAFAQIDPLRTQKWLQTLSPANRACFLKVLNGTHITQDGKVHCQEASSDICPYCESVDSRFHRFWQCEHFVPWRPDIDPALWQVLPHLPECATAYGWSLQPSTQHAWFEFLASQRVLDCVVSPPFSGHTLHLFTDGSCCNPQYPDARFASWAVVSADPTGIFQPEIVDSGPLPGLRQTSVRAEIFAVLRAVKIAKRLSCRVMLWCDCASVVKRLRRILQGSKVKINSPNADLWTVIAEDVLACTRVGITHVRAHQQISHAHTAFEEWCFVHNHFSDQAACRANVIRPPAFWTLLKQHLTACHLVDRWNAQIQQTILKVSQVVLQAAQVEDSPLPEPDDRLEVPPCDPLPALSGLPVGAIRERETSDQPTPEPSGVMDSVRASLNKAERMGGSYVPFVPWNLLDKAVN
eukprot:s15_g26.t1